MLGDCVGERLKLEVALRLGLANWLHSLVFAVKW